MNKEEKGALHPLTHVMNDCYQIMDNLGFQFVDGPELEDEWHNFDALNVPKDHPARDMHDTFWIKNQPGKVLRTHTSSVQIRYMQENPEPPIQIFSMGKAYRNERTDATHEAQFYQIEGLAVGEGISLGHLKGTLQEFFTGFFGEELEMRLRPSFFPFVEPGLEIDLKRADGKWLEVMGAGVVHPNVLRAVGIDPQKYSGFAFGGGIDRLAMIKYGISDLRHFYSGDLRLVNQFRKR